MPKYSSEFKRWFLELLSFPHKTRCLCLFRLPYHSVFSHIFPTHDPDQQTTGFPWEHLNLYLYKCTTSTLRAHPWVIPAETPDSNEAETSTQNTSCGLKQDSLMHETSFYKTVRSNVVGFKNLQKESSRDTCSECIIIAKKSSFSFLGLHLSRDNGCSFNPNPAFRTSAAAEVGVTRLMSTPFCLLWWLRLHAVFVLTFGADSKYSWKCDV